MVAMVTQQLLSVSFLTGTSSDTQIQSQANTHTHTHVQCVCDERQFRLLLTTHCANLSGCTHTRLIHIHTYIHMASVYDRKVQTVSLFHRPADSQQKKILKKWCVYFSKWAITIKIIKTAQRRRVSEWGDAREMRAVQYNEWDCIVSYFISLLPLTGYTTAPRVPLWSLHWSVGGRQHSFYFWLC